MSDPHRAAFDHALEVLKPDGFRIAYGAKLAFAFSVDLELTNGLSLLAKFGISGRFTCRIEARDSSIGTGDEHLADIHPRLAHYRKAIIDYQSTDPNPFTFRDFNRLLTALSYNPKSGTPESD